MTLRPAQLLRGLAVVVFLVAWALLAHFGSAGEGYFRISAFNSRANVEEVCRRIAALV